MQYVTKDYEWPSRFLELKREIVSATTPERLTSSWNEILAELATRTAEIAQDGSDFIPQVNFTDLDKLSLEEINTIKRKGCVIIRGVVDLETACGWKTQLEEFVKANPHAQGFPVDDKQFFLLYWTRSQVQARAHPNVLRASAWVSSLYHTEPGKTLEGVDLSIPLTYADRFRIRHPGTHWQDFPPHVDGGAIERWEDKKFRRCFEDIFAGHWRDHDPYDFEPRIDARSSLHSPQGQASVFRAFQGWLSMSETGPAQGTLRVFPDVKLSNAYLMLRPFFRPTVPEDSPDIFDPKNWSLDISTADFPGILQASWGYIGPCPTPQLHPHLRLEETMTSVPKVCPGDMVFWHCDMIHAVETEHTGAADSAVMYIAAVPKTPQNTAYIARQAQAFIKEQDPPDYHTEREGQTAYVGLGTDADIKEPIGRVAMGLPIEVA